MFYSRQRFPLSVTVKISSVHKNPSHLQPLTSGSWQSALLWWRLMLKHTQQCVLLVFSGKDCDSRDTWLSMKVTQARYRSNWCDYPCRFCDMQPFPIARSLRAKLFRTKLILHSSHAQIGTRGTKIDEAVLLACNLRSYPPSLIFRHAWSQVNLRVVRMRIKLLVGILATQATRHSVALPCPWEAVRAWYLLSDTIPRQVVSSRHEEGEWVWRFVRRPGKRRQTTQRLMMP